MLNSYFDVRLLKSLTSPTGTLGYELMECSKHTISYYLNGAVVDKIWISGMTQWWSIWTPDVHTYLTHCLGITTLDEMILMVNNELAIPGTPNRKRKAESQDVSDEPKHQETPKQDVKIENRVLTTTPIGTQVAPVAQDVKMVYTRREGDASFAITPSINRGMPMLGGSVTKAQEQGLVTPGTKLFVDEAVPDDDQESMTFDNINEKTARDLLGASESELDIEKAFSSPIVKNGITLTQADNSVYNIMG